MTMRNPDKTLIGAGALAGGIYGAMFTHSIGGTIAAALGWGLLTLLLSNIGEPTIAPHQ